MSRKHNRWRHANFVAIPREWFHGRCPEFKALPASAKLLYFYIKAGYNGSNNGQITFTYSRLKGHKGLSSPQVISSAIKELEKSGFIKRDNPGGLFKKKNEFRLTGKYDAYLSGE